MSASEQNSPSVSSSPASPPPRPASCISAARARRCSTGCSPAITAASSCCGSRTPTRPARPRRRSTRSSTGCAGSASIGTAHEYYQSQFWARHAEVAHRLLERGAAYRCYMTQEELAAQREKAAAERRPFRISSPWRDCAPDARRRTPLRHPPEGAARGRDGHRRPRSGPGHGAECRDRRFHPAALGRDARPTCLRWWSTITTWASPT